MVNERIQALRGEMEKRGMDIYMVPTADFHESEYVGEYFKARRFITGFTGSAGVAVITKKESGLWTDGRYFIQAANQLKGSEVELYKMGVEGVPTVEEFIKEKLPEGGCLGFDGRVVNTAEGQNLEAIVGEKHGSLKVEEDLIGLIWEDRPALSKEPAWLLDETYAGESAQSKMARVREEMEKAGADTHILTSLDDIAWLFNIRGNDATHFPIVLSFVILTQDRAEFFVNEEVLNDTIRAAFREYGVTIRGYEEIYDAVKAIPETSHVWMDCSKVNYRITNSLPKGVEIINRPNPTLLMKAVKNPTEIENIRKAHVKDGVAFTKYMYWLKTNIGKIPMTEITTADYLADRRKEQENFVDLSFDTISAYQANGAMMHYSATEESCAQLKPEGFLLVDSGAHYLEGSTDITRTMALGPITEKQKEYFTIVLRSNLNLAAAKFLYGCSGLNLDILSRGPLWDLGMDYRCGTGHGIGYLLNVHEAPNGFRWKHVPERNDGAILEAGMVTTDEPGVYLEGEFGIRTENELICVEDEKNEYGQFMRFETVTYAPIDLDAVDPEAMTKRERKLLNDYHKMVYEKVSPYLEPEEKEWLKKYTREI
ncbi:MAG TPA: aminopeptidase P family protein [Candidatus Fimimorpha excrementavium]|nr:aminopeptidase P family protein [Candidatus Fimimorpha excrementavium]